MKSFSIVGKVDILGNASSKIIINEIQTSEAETMMKSSNEKNELVILDVRTEDEYNDGCLEEAMNINFESSNFKKMITILDKQKTYLVYCRTGVRSKDAVELMSCMGFRKIYHMYEGIKGWKAQHLKVVDPK